MLMMNSVQSYIVFILTIIAFLLLVNGCSEDEATLSRENKIQADSIIREQTKLLVKEVDSLCNLAYKVQFDKAVDSVSKVRLAEIENYIPTK